MKLAKGSLQIPACRQYGRRRDYGLTIFAYSLSAFQAPSHIKRWPRGKPSGENSRPTPPPPPSFILIFTCIY